MKTLGFILAGLTFAQTASAVVPTFNKEIVRIFQRQCQTCHHPGYIAPFPLMSYADAKAHAAGIRSAVTGKRMPPWKPVEGCGEFRDERRLTATEIATIQQWADGGTPEGNASDLPPPVIFPEGWGLGEPDMNLMPTEPYTVGPTGEDDYRCFLLPYSPDKDEFLTAAEIRPDNTKIVHHVILFVDGKGESVKLDAQDPGLGYACKGGPGFQPIDSFGGWAPGSTPRHAPEGLGLKFPKGARIVMQVHYNRNGKTEVDRSRVGLHFAKKPIEHEIGLFGVYNTQFVLQPGDRSQLVTAYVTLPVAIKLVGVFPHMHLLGKNIKLTAYLPDGTNQCLINIDRWDFNWQGTYDFRNLVSLPKGTQLVLKATYDNSEQNPNQPNHPPKAVTWGEDTTDEMMIAFLSYILDEKKGTPNPLENGQPLLAELTRMGSQSLYVRAKLKSSMGMFGSSPTEMVNWAAGFTERRLGQTPWASSKGIGVPQAPSCH